MKQAYGRFVAMLAVGLLAFGAVQGCASFEKTAYRTIGTLSVTVDVAMNSWGEWVRSGHATADQEMQVRTAYGKYQASMKVAHDAVIGWKLLKNQGQTPDPASVNRALDLVQTAANGLSDLIGQFSSKKFVMKRITASDVDAYWGTVVGVGGWQ